MNRVKLTSLFASPCFLAVVALGGCSSGSDSSSSQSAAPAAPAAPAMLSSSAPAPAAPQGQTVNLSGKVVDTFNTGGYTYVQIDSNGQKVWAAGPETGTVKVGDMIELPGGMPMHNFTSKSLNKTFETIYFVGQIGTEGANLAGGSGELPVPGGAGGGQPGGGQMGGAMSGAMGGSMGGSMGGGGDPESVEVGNIAKADGGVSVEEVFAQKDQLAGTMVTIRGKVVKFSPRIMSYNWIHLRDGTGADGTNDLTVTTKAMANVGDTVLIKGVVAANKDFGAGYKYDVIIEDASVSVE